MPQESILLNKIRFIVAALIYSYLLTWCSTTSSASRFTIVGTETTTAHYVFDCKVLDFAYYTLPHSDTRMWFSGKMRRCHRRAPGSIPGLRIWFLLIEAVQLGAIGVNQV
jgi:hypothetical protein